jgi:hypothetical protein
MAVVPKTARHKKQRYTMTLPHHSILPQHNWWLWNVLEVCLRIFVLIIALFLFLVFWVSDRETVASLEPLVLLMWSSLALATASIFRFKNLAGFSVSFLAAFALLEPFCDDTSRDIICNEVLFYTLIVLMIVLVEYWLRVSSHLPDFIRPSFMGDNSPHHHVALAIPTEDDNIDMMSGLHTDYIPPFQEAVSGEHV